MTKRCPRCGQFMGEECRQCTDQLLFVACAVVNMAMLTTLVIDGRASDVITHFKAAFQRAISEAEC